MAGTRAQLCGLADQRPDFTAMFQVGVGGEGTDAELESDGQESASVVLAGELEELCAG